LMSHDMPTNRTCKEESVRYLGENCEARYQQATVETNERQ